MFVERLDDRPDRDRRIVSMQQVEVDVVGAQPHQRVSHVRGNVVRSDAVAVLVEVGTLADDDYFIAVAPFLHPQSEHAIHFAAAVAVSRVIRGDAGLPSSVEQNKAFFLIAAIEHDGALNYARDLFFDALYVAVLHEYFPFIPLGILGRSERGFRRGSASVPQFRRAT